MPASLHSSTNHPPTHEAMMTALSDYAPDWSMHFLTAFETACDSMALTPLEGMAMAVAAWTASVHSTVPRI